MPPPTIKQVKFINAICKELEIEFSPRSLYDAYVFINKNVSRFYASRIKTKEMFISFIKDL